METIEQILAEAAVPWVPGMQGIDGAIFIRHADCGEAWFTDIPDDGCELRILDDCTPNLEAPATRYLALAELARRCGLDPTWGVVWQLEPDGYWTVNTDGDFDSPPIPAEIDDPLHALALALRATKGED